jgi:hypothetical protein
MPRTQLRGRAPREAPAAGLRPPSGDASGPPAPAPRAKPDGTSHYRTCGGRNPPAARTRRSSPGANSKIFFPPAPWDGPRRAAPRGLPEQSHLQGDVPDSGAPARAAARARLRSAGTGAPLATGTSAERLPDRPRCSSGSAGGEGETDAHIPSAGNSVGDRHALGRRKDRHPLDAGTNNQHAEVGPREGLLPKGQVSERSVYFSPRRY